MEKLARLTALSNELSMDLLMKLQNSTVMDESEIYLDEYFGADKINFIEDLVLDNDMFNEVVFKDICNPNHTNTETTICPHYQPPLSLSYAEIISSDYRLFK